MRKINEIFYSLQGEGFHTGTAAVFVRFSGCNLKCDFCDTRHEEGTWMEDAAIIETVNQYPAKFVILTGGEPGLWIDDELIDRLHQAGKQVCIETNGTRPLPKAIDWITCSPKMGAPVVLERANEIKVVFIGQDVEAYRQRSRPTIISCNLVQARIRKRLSTISWPIPIGGSACRHTS